MHTGRPPTIPFSRVRIGPPEYGNCGAGSHVHGAKVTDVSRSLGTNQTSANARTAKAVAW